MNERILAAYKKAGFEVTPPLERFVAEFQAHEIQTAFAGISFFPEPLIRLGPSCEPYRATAQFLTSPVAPVAFAQGGNVELLLTKDGRLMGFADYLILSWGQDPLDWATVLCGVIAHDRPLVLGNAWDEILSYTDL